MTAADDDPLGLLEPAGICDVCHQHADERTAVSYVQGNSGPGGGAVGCLPCARRLVAQGRGHRWLAEDLAELDAARLPKKATG